MSASYAGGTYAGTAPTSTVSVGAANAERTITNVAAGRVAATSTDAVNGSELYATNQSISSISNGAGIKYFHANSTLADSQATGTDSVAIGPASTAGAANGVSIGNAATASANAGDVALGANSTTAAVAPTTSGTINGTTYTYAGTAPTSTVSVGAANAERTITNVAAGRVAATSTDAVNGSELYATNQAVAAGGTAVTNLGNSTASTLGGGATYNPTTGAVSGFSQPINPVSTTGAVGTATPQTTVAGALAALNTNVDNTANIAVKYDSVGGNTITLGATGGAGAPAAGVKITNLTAATINSTSTDAVNGSQLYGVSNSVASGLGGGSTVNPDGTVSAPTYTVGGSTYSNVGAALTAINTTGIKYFHANSTGKWLDKSLGIVPRQWP